MKSSSHTEGSVVNLSTNPLRFLTLVWSNDQDKHERVLRQQVFDSLVDGLFPQQMGHTLHFAKTGSKTRHRAYPHGNKMCTELQRQEPIVTATKAVPIDTTHCTSSCTCATQTHTCHFVVSSISAPTPGAPISPIGSSSRIAFETPAVPVPFRSARFSSASTSSLTPKACRIPAHITPK